VWLSSLLFHLGLAEFCINMVLFTLDTTIHKNAFVTSEKLVGNGLVLCHSSMASKLSSEPRTDVQVLDTLQGLLWGLRA